MLIICSIGVGFFRIGSYMAFLERKKQISFKARVR